MDVDAAFVDRKDGAYGFTLGPYDPGYELTIDPLVLAYSTYLGGCFQFQAHPDKLGNISFVAEAGQRAQRLCRRLFLQTLHDGGN
mgnify:CR=1 FL=1